MDRFFASPLFLIAAFFIGGGFAGPSVPGIIGPGTETEQQALRAERSIASPRVLQELYSGDTTKTEITSITEKQMRADERRQDLELLGEQAYKDLYGK